MLGSVPTITTVKWLKKKVFLHIKSIKILTGKEVIDSGKSPAAHTHWYLHNKARPLWVLQSEITSRCIHVCRSESKSRCGQELNDVNVMCSSLMWFKRCYLRSSYLADSSRRQMTAIANFPYNYRFGGALHFTDYPRQHKPEGVRVSSQGMSLAEIQRKQHGWVWASYSLKTLNQRELEWKRGCTHIWLLYFAW